MGTPERMNFLRIRQRHVTAKMSGQNLTLNSVPSTSPLDRMAKSLRSKVKLAARRKRASQSHYAVADAARTARISARLLGSGTAKRPVQPLTNDNEAMDDDEESRSVDEAMSGESPRHLAVPRSNGCHRTRRVDR